MPDDDLAQRDIEDVTQANGDLPEDPNDESTVGVGSAFAIGCTLIILLITLGGVCYLVAQRAF